MDRSLKSRQETECAVSFREIAAAFMLNIGYAKVSDEKALSQSGVDWKEQERLVDQALWCLGKAIGTRLMDDTIQTLARDFSEALTSSGFSARVGGELASQIEEKFRRALLSHRSSVIADDSSFLLRIGNSKHHSHRETLAIAPDTP